MRVWFAALALFACSSESSDVTGPFTGEVKRFVVDAIQIPRDGAEAAALAADLDGDGAADTSSATSPPCSRARTICRRTPRT